MNNEENKNKLKSVIEFFKNQALKLTYKDWIITGLLFLYVDEFRGLVLATISVAFILNFLMLSKNDKGE